MISEQRMLLLNLDTTIMMTSTTKCLDRIFTFISVSKKSITALVCRGHTVQKLLFGKSISTNQISSKGGGLLQADLNAISKRAAWCVFGQYHL